jgi:YesN/AraC family two-component response regulator
MKEENYYNWHESLTHKVEENMRIGDDLIIISESIVSKTMSAPRKVDVTTFIITDNGNAKAMIDTKTYSLQSPCLAVVMPGQTYHLVEASEDISFRAVIMSKRFTEGFLGHYHGSSRLQSMIKESPVLDLSRDMHSFDTYYKMLLHAVKSPVKQFRMESAQHLTLSMLYYYAQKLETTSKSKDKRQLHYEQFIEDVKSYYKINRTLPFYAGKLGVSVTYLTELIKEKHGMTAADYIDRHTATECMALLNSTHLSINQISRSLNFPSPSVFGKFFKRMTGNSPTEYRGEQI